MATLTANLFRGTGETDHRLEVVDGEWPRDIDGHMFIVGPDNRKPARHWFAASGLLCRVSCRPDSRGRIEVRQRLIRTPLMRIREKVPWLFARVAFAELSPFGVTNQANTNVEPIDGRLFIGYDAGRPIEVDGQTMQYLTPVGSNGEWFQAMPGIYEPMVSVAAHPASALDEHALYFVNYTPVPSPSGEPQVSIARWALDGPLKRWPLTGVEQFETIHDVKVTSDHLVFSDLPFAVGPEAMGFGERTVPNSDVTRLTIVAKKDLLDTEPGRPVRARSITVPMPTGHLSVDHDEVDGILTVYLEHIPLADLMIALAPGEPTHFDGGPVPEDYSGLVATNVQPGAVGRYRIRAATGELIESTVATDQRFWGPLIAARDTSTLRARRTGRQLWFAGMGFDPDLVPESWWKLYGEAELNSLVSPSDLPREPVPAALARFDLDAMEVVEVWQFTDGAFASPPVFVPRRSERGEPAPVDDGYLIVLVHRDGDKEIQVFDSLDLGKGPVARASAAGFNPPLLLHGCWTSRIERRSSYRVSVLSDVVGAVKDLPRHMVSMFRTAWAMRPR
jgi:carotenoid cleavage dioxygenase-like enzyme